MTVEIDIVQSKHNDKKFTAIIHKDNGKNKQVHFGAKGYSDYTTSHKDSERKQRYISRHKALGENWGSRGYETAGWFSKNILWNKPSVKESVKDINKKFKNIHVQVKEC